MLPRTAAQVLMPPDGAFKTHTSLRETLNQADLDLPYFRTTETKQSRLDAICQSKTPGTTLHRETHVIRKPAFILQLILIRKNHKFLKNLKI